MPAKRIIISGRVQGVFYRATAKQIADQLGLKGWVRNLKSGEVEAFVCGEESGIKLFIEWAWRGPDMAIVEMLEIFDEKEVDMEKFQIKR